MFHVIEKSNPLALHLIADKREQAEHWINTKAPEYCARGFFDDKTLTPDSFTIKEFKKS